MRSAVHEDRIVIIGGGISGLSSAFYLLRDAAQRGVRLHVTIVDPAASLGGKISTLRRDGFIIEKGPDSFLTRKTPIIELARELGLENELVAQNPSGKKTYIVRRSKLHPMPPGLMLGIPTEIMPFAKTGLLTVKAKLRAMMDFVMPARKGDEDESIGDFLERRVGREVMERVAEPLLAGIYAGELRKLSLRATFPQFRQAELKHGSLIRGMRRNRKAGAASIPAQLPAAIRSSMFLSFKGGLASLVQGLDSALTEAGAERRLGVKAEAIHTKREDAVKGSSPRYEVELNNGERLEADAIIVTSPAYDAVPLLERHLNVDELRAIRYVSVANVALAYEKAAFGQEFDGSGFLVPRTEGRHITACTWTSTKWLHTSPDDKVLLRCYVGRSGDEESVELPDDQLALIVQRDIREILGITAVPLFTEITRLRRSMPQYPVGHVEQSAVLKKRLAETLPGVWITGAAFEGVGLPDCIKQGKETALKAMDELANQGLQPE